MQWFAAHIITFIECVDGPQKEYPVMEDVLLICAQSTEKAWARAEKYGRQRAKGHTLTWDDRSARLVYQGVRRIMAIFDADSGGRCRKFGEFQDGLEITFSALTVPTKEDVRKLANNESVTVIYQSRMGLDAPD